MGTWKFILHTSNMQTLSMFISAPKSSDMAALVFGQLGRVCSYRYKIIEFAHPLFCEAGTSEYPGTHIRHPQ